MVMVRVAENILWLVTKLFQTKRGCNPGDGDGDGDGYPH
jgi:hypothetical protein